MGSGWRVYTLQPRVYPETLKGWVHDPGAGLTLTVTTNPDPETDCEPAPNPNPNPDTDPDTDTIMPRQCLRKKRAQTRIVTLSVSPVL